MRWFHPIDLGNGEVTPGEGKSLEMVAAEAAIYFKHGVAGKSVLDIGAWDGAFSFEAERRGARLVKATDHFCWVGDGWGKKECFDYAHRKLGSKVESQIIAVPDITPEAIGGQFDVVLFAGVLYHVKDPHVYLERAAAVARETLVVETVTALNDRSEPLTVLFPNGTMGGDASNFYAVNVAWIESVLRTAGFSRFDVTPSPSAPPPGHAYTRHIVHAHR